MRESAAGRPTAAETNQLTELCDYTAFLADHDHTKLYKAAGATAAPAASAPGEKAACPKLSYGMHAGPFDLHWLPSAGTREVEHECQCCFTDSQIAETTAMSCGHRFCNDCWSQVRPASGFSITCTKQTSLVGRSSLSSPKVSV